MKQLEKSFIGKGEVRGFKFEMVHSTPLGYVYAVKDDNVTHYEVFKHKENTRFKCISYPTSKAFGVWAWSMTNLDKAKQKLESFKTEEA